MHLLDLVFGWAARGPRFFPDGWGDRAICDAIQPSAIVHRPTARLEVALAPSQQAYGGTLSEGTFMSPEARLPDCARRARIQVLLPRGRPLRGVALHFAASGDQGFAIRLRFAAPLLESGLGAMVLENPFYGARKPEQQARHAIRSVAELQLMGAAAFQEGRALLRWAREALGAPLVGVTGYSMGGQMAAMVGASMNVPVAIVPVAATCSPDSVLRDGVMRHVADFAALASKGETADDARRLLFTHLARFSVTALKPPVLPEAAIVVGTADDGVVPPSEMRKIADHWGCELRWLPAGHVTAVLRHQAPMREAIGDAFLRLEAALARTRSARRRWLTARPRRARDTAGIDLGASSRARPHPA